MLEHTQDSQQHSQPGSHEDNEFYAEELDNQSNYDESMPVIAHKRQKIRPLPDRTGTPESKDEIIRYLTERLQHAENAIDDSRNYLTRQKQKRKLLNDHLDSTLQKVEQIRDEEYRTLQEKIDQRLDLTLQKAAQDKIAAEKALKEARLLLSEKERMIEELDYTVLRLHVENTEKDKHIVELNQIIDKKNQKIHELNNINKGLQEDITKKAQKISELTEDVAEMRGLILKLSDAKNVLTRVFDNSENFSKKAQNIIGSPSIFTTVKREDKPESTRAVSKSREFEKPAFSGRKPEYLVNEDDFWYSNPMPKSNKYAQAYGGRNKNYNEHYLYGAQKTNDLQGNSQNAQASIIDKSRQSTPSEKLPKIQRGQNAEILYRADEYFDEFSKKPNTTKRVNQSLSLARKNNF